MRWTYDIATALEDRVTDHQRSHINTTKLASQIAESRRRTKLKGPTDHRPRQSPWHSTFLLYTTGRSMVY